MNDAAAMVSAESLARANRLFYFCPRDVACILVACVPFAAIYAAHFFSWNGVPTGFIHTDMPYYVANGREVFEHGNGFAYPNPYDPAADAPVIYFHWLVWLLGFGIVHCGADPGLLFVGVGVAGGLLMSTMTLCLVRQMLPRPEFRRPLFLLAMWGGGLLCIGRLAVNLISGGPLTDQLLAYDPGGGLWFLNWGRNLTFPTEAMYHGLVAACWLFAICRRYRTSLVFALLLAATHPWSGLEVLTTMAGFHAGRLLFFDGRSTTVHLGVSVAALVIFLGYNLVYLDSFEQHRVLHQTWSLDWSLSGVSMTLAWLPLAALAAWRLLSDTPSLNRTEWLLIVAFGVAFLLSVHDRFISPTQPLHFTRGYVWMPLFLLSLPLMQRWLVAASERLSTTTMTAGLTALIAFGAFDNLCFMSNQIAAQQHADGEYFLSADERELLRQIDDHELRGVVVVSDSTLGYLTATYTGLTPYVGHLFNTPNRDDRVEHVKRLYAGTDPDTIEWLNDVDFVILDRTKPGEWSLARREGWEGELTCGDLALCRVQP